MNCRGRGAYLSVDTCERLALQQPPPYVQSNQGPAAGPLVFSLRLLVRRFIQIVVPIGMGETQGTQGCPGDRGARYGCGKTSLSK